MRIKLVFPPRTSPTYVPLGIASLYSIALQSEANVGVFDANIDLWNQVCDNDPGFTAMRKFSHAPMGIFLRQEIYERNFRHMPAARQCIDSLARQAKLYLEQGELAPELSLVLTRQSMRICFDDPGTIAFSAMYPDQLAFILAQAKYLSGSGSDAAIIIGGAAMSAISPVELLEAFPFINAIFTGEGEIPFSLLLQGQEYSRIPGSYYRGPDGNIEFSGKTQYLKTLHELAAPDYSCFDLKQYFNPLPVLPMLGGRGCKWRQCSFCSHNSSFGTYRARPVMGLVREMTALRDNFNCRHFYFADQYVDPAFLSELCDTIIAAGLKCSFHIMARTTGEYTPALLEKAARAGCRWISWGMESGSQRLLDIMHKGTEAASSEKVIKAAADVGISNLLMMIFGAPGSDEQCLDETFAFLDKVYGSIDSMTASAFVLFENTKFSRHASRYGLQAIGKNEIFRVNGKVVHDAKLRFRREGENGSGESPLAAREIELWERRKIWLGPQPFVSKLCCEHYLLYADAIKSGNRPGSLRIGA
jgi:hypothetical protein